MELKQIKADWLDWANSFKTNDNDFLIPCEMRPLNIADFKLLSLVNHEMHNDNVNGRIVYVCQLPNNN